jgi:hypothetical protein
MASVHPVRPGCSSRSVTSQLPSKAANSVLWVRDGVTLRLDGPVPLDVARQVAATIR